MTTLTQTHYDKYGMELFPLHRENKVLYTWLVEILNNELNMLANLTEERIKLRDTATQKAGLKAMLYNAETVVEKVREYEMPKLTKPNEISEVDRLITLITEYITKINKIMKKY